MKLLYDSGFILAGAVVATALLFAYSNLQNHSHEEGKECPYTSTR